MEVYIKLETLIKLIETNQSFLLKRILYYAKLHDYAKYTSTLEEAWATSISGISEALIECIQNEKNVPEINVDQDFMNEEITSFGRMEAQRHRQRGITLEMYLGLIKYYRQSYIDLIEDSIINQKEQHIYTLWVNRFFDHTEIAFCKEWNVNSKETLITELQNTNRMLTNEKNKYLTIFESIPTPVILFDANHYCINLNYAAQQFLQENLNAPGHVYYMDNHNQKADVVIPCIIDKYYSFCAGNKDKSDIETICELPTNVKKNINIKFHRMLDVSGKFTGTVVILTDQTEQKDIEAQLRYMSFYDILTGLSNRSYFEQEIARLSGKTGLVVGIISCDIDGLKLVNDNLGHHAGDLLIRSVGSILKSSFRKSDMVCRIGGDEFLALMPETDEKTVQEIYQKIRMKIKQHNQKNLIKPISISIGWAIGKLCTANDIHELIKDADRLMYGEKKTNHDNYNRLFMERFQKYGKGLFA